MIRRSVVDPVHVGHEDCKIGSDLDGYPGSKAVVVSDVEEGAVAALVVLLLWRTDGVVGVDDGDDVQLKQLVDSGEKLEKNNFFVKMIIYCYFTLRQL